MIAKLSPPPLHQHDHHPLPPTSHCTILVQVPSLTLRMRNSKNQPCFDRQFLMTNDTQTIKIRLPNIETNDGPLFVFLIQWLTQLENSCSNPEDIRTCTQLKH